MSKKFQLKKESRPSGSRVSKRYFTPFCCVVIKKSPFLKDTFSTKKIKISSGNYSVAASACGYNYAGTENLNGDYSVKYYIASQYR